MWTIRGSGFGVGGRNPNPPTPTPRDPGRARHIDLTAQTVVEIPLPGELLRRYIGGVGLATALLYAFAPDEVEPLGPENPLVFATSPLVGTRVTTSSKFAVAARSPLTGFIGDSLSSSYFAVALKKAGVDALVLTGRAERWTTLVVGEEGVVFRDAEPLRGLGTAETEAAVRAALGDRTARVAAIGPAGEHLVRYATISNDGRHAGRTGGGAVMGSKNLKALAVRGSRRIAVAAPARLEALARQLRARSLGPATAKYRVLGTPANLLAFHRLGALPARNFQGGAFAAAEALSGEALHAGYLARTATCAACTIGCAHFYATPSGESAHLEYETLYALGPLCGVGEPERVIGAAALCDQLGLDTISAGGTIAWAMEGFERGLLTEAETDGLAVRFGNGDALAPLLGRIARREGIGDLLAEGSRRAAARLGGGSEGWAMHVKGLELPGYEPRSLKTMALGLAVGSRGACHNRSSAYEVDFSDRVDRFRAEVGRGRLAAESEDRAAVMDSLILCKFVRHCLDDFYVDSAELLGAVTGWDVCADELRSAGARITNLKKAFNLRMGWQPEDDWLPERLLFEPLETEVAGEVGLTAADLRTMIGAYYAARGWTAEGTIPPAVGRALDLPAPFGPDRLLAELPR
jgi:aldehyde:ferredoxin oxidoreductase